MPVVAYVTLLPNRIRPACVGCKALRVKQKVEVLFGHGCKARCSDVGHNRVALGPPGRKLCGNKSCQEKESDNFFYGTLDHQKPQTTQKMKNVDAGQIERLLTQFSR